MNQKILIISYTFPPSPGVGGRRWAKFAKYLHREGYNIQVISAKNQFNHQSQWLKDIQEIENKIHWLDSGYPKHFGFYSTNFLHKVKYRLGEAKSKLVTKGNYYDKSIHWLNSLKGSVRYYYDQGFRTIIVTVAPFHSALALSELKEELPDMKLVVDFRDPWTTNLTAYGFEGLSIERKKFEKEAEKKVINSADLVVSVSDEMNDYFESICSSKTFFETIPNGYDPEDLPKLKPITNTDKLTFVFAGTLYEKSLHQFLFFVEALDKLEQEKPEVYSSLSFQFYGSIPEEVAHHFSRHSALDFNGKIPLSQVYEVISVAHGCLLFLSDDLNYSLSTKFYEYVAMKKPILLFAKMGRTSQVIEENTLGFHVTQSNVQHLFSELDQTLKMHKPTINVEQFSVPALTERLTNTLSKIVN